ncbi:MAG TPA: helix-turn-helix transcriptional regulator [Pyrinomonadaceae bacterium]|nr:helix-turn-helix transcriptional regulator [Pyrinomonadaceae bacterium]
MSPIRNLKSLRESRKVTIREVELESRRIAEAKGDKRFYISNTRLNQLENDSLSEPSLWKLFSLSAIYNVSITELMRLYNVDADESDKYNLIASPDRTQLLSSRPEPFRVAESLEHYVTAPDKTMLLPTNDSRANSNVDLPIPDQEDEHISYGYIGLDDFTMYPLIRPGSFVMIDTRESKLPLIAGRNEYQRPIYFIELRNAYACGWCDLQGNQLLLVPHHSSPVGIKRFVYLKEAEVIGRLIKYSTPCIDQRAEIQKLAKRGSERAMRH